MISSRAHIVRMEYIYGLQNKKYLHIYDWNYWWGYYRCGKDWDPFDAAEFSLSEDEAGEAPFSTLISITSPHFTRPFGTVSLWSRITRIIRTFWSRQGGSEAVNRTGSSGRCTIRFFTGDAFLQRLRPERRPADTAAFPVCTALLRGDLSPGGAPPHSGGADALGGDTVPTPIRPAVFLYACTSPQPTGGNGAV